MAEADPQWVEKRFGAYFMGRPAFGWWHGRDDRAEDQGYCGPMVDITTHGHSERELMCVVCSWSIKVPLEDQEMK